MRAGLAITLEMPIRVDLDLLKALDSSEMLDDRKGKCYLRLPELHEHGLLLDFFGVCSSTNELKL